MYIIDDICQKVEDESSRVVDIVGVPAMDSKVASTMIKISKAIHYMGAACIITGISPQVAQTVVRLNVNFENAITKSRLRDGVEEAFRILGLEVSAKTFI